MVNKITKEKIKELKGFISFEKKIVEDLLTSQKAINYLLFEKTEMLNDSEKELRELEKH